MGVAAQTVQFEALALATVLGLACGSAPLRIEYEPDGHLLTSRGERLYRVRATRVGAVYLKPGVQFSDYAAVAIKPVEVSYKSPPRATARFSQRPGNYVLHLDSMDRLKRELRRALTHELAGSEGLTVVSEGADDELRVSPQIVDLIWEVPFAQGGESSYVTRTGAMTVTLEVRDSRTGELLVLVADRREIRPEGESLVGGFENRPVNNWAGVRAVSTHWARLLRATFDELRELPPMAPPAPPAEPTPSQTGPTS